MDIELERRIELLEWQRDNAMRIRCPLVAKKYQRMIDKLAKESRNRSTDKTEARGNDYRYSNQDNQQV
ncbi:hypothetical protein [Bacteroides clarus]|uniref:hypothetical protein n=1 Tax=Bacteroides clarus TaxID=626929 RepID=UPI00241F148C|nr:hypothetical protein [Bacteroides clarus]